MQGQLSRAAGDVVLYGPKFTTDPASLTCSPPGAPNSPTLHLHPKDQWDGQPDGLCRQRRAAVPDRADQGEAPRQLALVTSQICPDGPKVGTDATANHATITCPATANVGWDWTPDALNQLAQVIAGLGVGSAALQLNQTQGIAPARPRLISSMVRSCPTLPAPSRSPSRHKE